MAFDPGSVLGPLAGLAEYLVLAIVLMLAFTANARHGGVFAVAIGAVLAFFMGAGWIPANYTLAGIIVFAGFLGVLVGRRG